MSSIETLRIATLNMFGLRENWAARRKLIAEGFAEFSPDLVALQETATNGSVDQAREVLGDGYQFVHHTEREADGQGISVASRWPVTAVHEVELPSGPRPAGFVCSALVTEIEAPDPVGRLLFVNHLPDWQLTHEAERERQTVAVARAIEDLVGTARRHVIVAGDLDATPDAASIRFWTGKQSLEGFSVCYRDAWAATHANEPGHTFTPENTLTTTAEVGDWELELGRRIDYIFIRCSEYGPTLDVARCRRLFDQPRGGTWPSDHFGVGAELAAVTPSGRPVP
ncbi:endonuclease/exonuclease/phosphatase family metal-dependent hydrolase [Kribbella voronezhensis]|uniref:Endonuclease/exonuclease/phosphatase family metal-dependent hydrolase n=1 Tax=Kribbella voronezhensis TaxID=2512212 RepID=A0A4R7SYM4_9ACTN|nr:endonuclease/exonuclease/phosphatase family protein [Kribbella voronezhensis]TDU84434.1 endonuclease/exonuclease/phosphatase family metal-dependent hydrolase [Kribbella voronezhensis]